MGRLVKKNTPAEVVVVALTAWVAVWVTVTVAVGITAPLGSVTVPEIVPVISCAKRGNEPRASAINSARSPLRTTLPNIDTSFFPNREGDFDTESP
jgi:hypothetical protein